MVVSAGWFNRGDFTDVWQASVMFKVPLYFWNKSAGVRAASAELGSARYDTNRRSSWSSRRSRTSTPWQNLGAAPQPVRGRDHPQARMALQSAASNYQVGKIDFLMLLDSQTLLFKYQLAYQEELVNLNKTIAQIEETTGGAEN